jgi:hypothetical protein
VTAAWICNSNHKSRLALALVGAPLATVVVAASLLVPHSFTSGAAMAVAIAGAVGAVGALAVLIRFYGARLSPVFALKIIAAVCLVEVAARAWAPAGKLAILLKLIALAVLFVTVVVATRAVTLEEVRGLRRAR